MEGRVELVIVILAVSGPSAKGCIQTTLNRFRDDTDLGLAWPFVACPVEQGTQFGRGRGHRVRTGAQSVGHEAGQHVQVAEWSLLNCFTRRRRSRRRAW